MSSGHLLLSCAKRAATTKIDLFAYLWQLPCALCSLILMTLTLWGAYHTARYLKKKMTTAQFEQWSRYAVELRQSAEAGEMEMADYQRELRV